MISPAVAVVPGFSTTKAFMPRPIVVGNPEHGAFEDGGVSIDAFLDLHGIDVLASMIMSFARSTM